MSLLKWLVAHLEAPQRETAWGEGETRRKREALRQQDADTIEEALNHLTVVSDERHWAILEGPSQPDVFLATDEMLVVIEGKRTESGPTTTTTWMPVRHQMLRHLDAAWEIRKGRSVYGFFVVEEQSGCGPGTIPPVWQAAAESTISASALDSSLPHRTSEQRREISEAFLGVTTWQAVCSRFNVPPTVLIDKVV